MNANGAGGPQAVVTAVGVPRVPDSGRGEDGSTAGSVRINDQDKPRTV